MYCSDVLKKAISVYGTDAQLLMAIEEMSELIKELCKVSRKQTDVSKISEEIADVSIMLEQLLIIFDCEESVDDWIISKIERLEHNLDR